MALADFLIPMTIFAFLWTGVNDSKIRKLQREAPSRYHYHQWRAHEHSNVFYLGTDPDYTISTNRTSKPGGYDYDSIYENTSELAGVRGWY